jgi:hypothetical protein
MKLGLWSGFDYARLKKLQSNCKVTSCSVNASMVLSSICSRENWNDNSKYYICYYAVWEVLYISSTIITNLYLNICTQVTFLTRNRSISSFTANITSAYEGKESIAYRAQSGHPVRFSPHVHN